ncbi:MAG: NAD-dependent epimerase/dehydratase family protein [Candidatus Limnocylindrales bacterium]
MRVLVTGGAGFIGHHLVGGLVAGGHEVNVIDDFSSGCRWRLEPFEGRIAITTGSILDPSALDQAVAGCEVVFHLAAIASVARSAVAPRWTNEVNVSGTIETMLAASRHRVRRVVFAGSSAVYGVPESLPSAELLRPAPQSPYGVSKLAGEHYVHTLGALHNVETVALRYFNVFGPGQDPTSEYAAVVPRFVTAVLGGSVPVINGDGGITRDFVYVDNVVQANLLASLPSSPSGLTCNIASGTRTGLLELLEAICQAAGRRVEPLLGPPRAGDIRHSQADISLAHSRLGYRVSISFEEGIARTVAWYRNRAELSG